MKSFLIAYSIGLLIILLSLCVNVECRSMAGKITTVPTTTAPIDPIKPSNRKSTNNTKPVTLTQPSTAITTSTNTVSHKEFADLQANYVQFTKNIHLFPTNKNTIDAIAGSDKNKQSQIVAYAQDTYPIIDTKAIELCNAFITFKKNNGSDIEKSLYNRMTLSNFIIRCLEKRPLVFMTEHDSSLLREPNAKLTNMDFTKIGTLQEQKPLILADYLSYDEMKIAALIGVSSPTYFINNGNRNNSGEIGQENTFQKEGVYSGLVGARFEKPNFMEWQDMIITQEQNTAKNGYGLKKSNQGLIGLWSHFYSYKFPTYDEAVADKTGQYVPYNQNFFNRTVYKKRMELVIKPFLRDANIRGKKHNKKVYVHTVGLGLGVWAILQEEQTKCIIEVFKEIIHNNTFAHIADIDFSWFMDNASTLVPNMKNGDFCTDKNNNSIAIHFSQRNPADKLIGKDTDKLLIACYAWDGNAYPGNEYWAGMLTASGDPAAACCSLIGTVQNILINPWLKKNINQIYGSIQSGHHHKIKPKYKAKYRLNSFFKTAIVQKKN